MRPTVKKERIINKKRRQKGEEEVKKKIKKKVEVHVTYQSFKGKKGKIQTINI